MYFLENGGIVIDNPGVREVGLADANRGIDSFFDEIIALAKECRYVDCTHAHEPGCAVIEAVRSGELDEEKYLNYLNLRKETDYYEMNNVEKREKDRRFGKFKKNVKKDLKNFGFLP
jgi:ribosome biogenesis GTPase